jgi:hypothetical protein
MASVVSSTLPARRRLIRNFVQEMATTRPSDEQLRGMTVNERLFACGLLDAWDEYARRRDRSQMIALLLRAAIDREQAELTTDAVINNPAMYGF